MSNVVNLIDRAAGCVHCGAGLGKCNCWIILRCPCCHKRIRAEREPNDPADAAQLVLRCPGCEGKSSPNPHYLDRNGRVMRPKRKLSA